MEALGWLVSLETVLLPALLVDWSNLGSGGGGISLIADQNVIPAVAATPGWQVVSAFYTDKAPTAIALDAILLLSNAALVGRVRLWDTGLNAAGALVGVAQQVPGALLTFTNNVIDNRQVTADISAGMVISRIYQLQVEGTGGAASTDFAVLRSGRMVKP